MRSLLLAVGWVVAGGLVLGGPATEAAAQSFQGGLRGSVKDAQGVIPGVTVTLTNEANGVTRDTVSNASGEYSFPALDPAATPSRRRCRDSRPSIGAASASARSSS